MTVRSSAGGGQIPRGALVAIAAALFALGAKGGAGVVAQSTPVIPPPAEAPTIATVPAGEAAPETEVAPLRLQTIAQGLVKVEGTVVWRVRQVASAAEAEPAAGVGFSFTLQREGASVVEDEAGGRGALLQTGEAVFLEAGAPEARRAFGADPATVWVIELVASNARGGEGLAAGTVLFTSDLIDDYPAGEVEAELRRGVLGGGEGGPLPAQSGAALVIVTEGSLEVDAGGTASTVNAGGSVLVPEGTTITNAAAEPSGFVVAALGESVAPAPAPAPAADPSATPAAAAQETDAADDPATTPAAREEETDAAAAADAAPTPAAEVAPSAADTDGDGLSDEEEAIYGSDPLNSDYDADGLLDGVEVNVYGSDPVNNDTDGDTLVDGDEVNQFGSNPASSDGDGDTIGDASEIYEFGTSPSNFDTDGDGAADGDEVAVGTDPNDATSTP